MASKPRIHVPSTYAVPGTFQQSISQAPAPEPSIVDSWKLLTTQKQGDNFGRSFYLCADTDKWICWQDEWESNLSDMQRGKIIAKAQKYLVDMETLGKAYNSKLLN